MENKLSHSIVLDYFYEICKIPHTTYHEQELSKWIVNKLKEAGATVYVDKIGQIYASI